MKRSGYIVNRLLAATTYEISKGAVSFVWEGQVKQIILDTAPWILITYKGNAYFER